MDRSPAMPQLRDVSNEQSMMERKPGVPALGTCLLLIHTIVSALAAYLQCLLLHMHLHTHAASMLQNHQCWQCWGCQHTQQRCL